MRPRVDFSFITSSSTTSVSAIEKVTVLKKRYASAITASSLLIIMAPAAERALGEQRVEPVLGYPGRRLGGRLERHADEERGHRQQLPAHVVQVSIAVAAAVTGGG